MEDKREAEIERALREVIQRNEYVRFLGMEILELRTGYGLARMRFKGELANPYGMLHGGSLYSMADIVAGGVACMYGNYVTTVSGTLNFLLPAKETEYVYCEAKQLRQGMHLAVYEVKIKDDEGKLLDSGEFSFFVTQQSVLS